MSHGRDSTALNTCRVPRRHASSARRDNRASSSYDASKCRRSDNYIYWTVVLSHTIQYHSLDRIVSILICVFEGGRWRRSAPAHDLRMSLSVMGSAGCRNACDPPDLPGCPIYSGRETSSSAPAGLRRDLRGGSRHVDPWSPCHTCDAGEVGLCGDRLPSGLRRLAVSGSGVGPAPLGRFPRLLQQAIQLATPMREVALSRVREPEGLRTSGSARSRC